MTSTYCHCEERSDFLIFVIASDSEAISFFVFFLSEIATPPLREARNDNGWSFLKKRLRGFPSGSLAMTEKGKIATPAFGGLAMTKKKTTFFLASPISS